MLRHTQVVELNPLVDFSCGAAVFTSHYSRLGRLTIHFLHRLFNTGLLCVCRMPSFPVQRVST